MLTEDRKIEMRLQAWAELTGCEVKDRTLVSVPEDTERIRIPEGIEIIGGHAFVPKYKRYASREDAERVPTPLKEVHLPLSLKKIGLYAFQYCVNLKGLEISPNVTEIEFVAFADCTGLEKIRLPEGLLKMGSCLFENCVSLRSLEIPWGVKEILWNFCENCVNLEEIILPDSLELISERAFRNCRKLHQVAFPFSLRKMEKYAFQGCTSLEKITYCRNLQSIGSYAFDGCERLAEIQGPNLSSFSRAFRNTPYGLAHLSQAGPYLPRKMVGVRMGKWLIDLGYDFFEEDREYTIAEPDENGVVEVSSWSGTEGPDEDGFGMEEMYDWWLLDENLQQIPGIACWHGFSTGDMRANQKRWAELQQEAGKILSRRNAEEERKV